MHKDPNKIRVAIYTRGSTEQQITRDILPYQKDSLEKIRNGEFTHLLVWKIDRISRNLIDFSKLYEDLSKHLVTS